MREGLQAFIEVAAGTPNDNGAIGNVSTLAPPQQQMLRAGVSRVRSDIDAAISELTAGAAVEAARRLNKEEQRQVLIGELHEAGRTFSRVDRLLGGNEPAGREARRAVPLQALSERGRTLLAAIAAFELSDGRSDATGELNASNGSPGG